jgi:hypothetical protein
VTLLALVALTACSPKAPPTTLASGGFVQAVAPASGDTRLRMRVALDAAPVAPCYEAALLRAPDLWGEVVAELELDATGAVSESSVYLTTVADDALVACVLEVARGIRFPAPPQAGLRVRYPWVFTSDRTPPEVARALRVRYAGEPAVPPGDPHDRRTPLAPGTVTLW